ncbi:unnamed protein product, partial [Trichobilharzia regenti]
MIPWSKKGKGTLEASRKVSDAELLPYSNDMYDAQHDEYVLHVSLSRDNWPKFEPRYSDGNPADHLEFVKEFEIMLSSFLINDEMKLMYLMRSGHRESFMASSNPYKLSECNRFRGTSPTDKLQDARKTWLRFTRLLCDDNGAVKKPVVATGKPLLDRVPRTTPQFVQEKTVTVSESSSDFTSLQGVTSRSKGIKPSRIHEEESKTSTAVIEEFVNDEVDHTNGGKVNICDNDHDSADLSLADRDEMSGMRTTTTTTTTELNKSSVQLERVLE